MDNNLRSFDDIAQELFDLMINGECNEDLINKFYELIRVHREEKQIVGKSLKKIFDFIGR